MMGRRIWQVVKKEFIQVWRDRRLRIFLFLPPVVQLIIYGYAINFDIRQVPFAVFDEDRTQVSQSLTSRFTASDYFSLVGYLTSEAELRGLIDRSRITLAVHIPNGFADKLKANKPASLQLILDATDSNTALIVAHYARTILNDYSREILGQTLRRLDLPKPLQTPVVIEARALVNPNLESKNAFVPGVIALVVMLVSLMLTALSVVREREIGTMAQILVSPLSPWEFLSGKTIPFILISLVDVTLVTLMGVFWFGIPFQGSVIVLFVGTLSFLPQFRGVRTADLDGLLNPATGGNGRDLHPDPRGAALGFDIPDSQHGPHFSIYYACQSVKIPDRHRAGGFSGRPGFCGPVAPNGRHGRTGGGFSGAQHHPLSGPIGLIPRQSQHLPVRAGTSNRPPKVFLLLLAGTEACPTDGFVACGTENGRGGIVKSENRGLTPRAFPYGNNRRREVRGGFWGHGCGNP